MRNWFVRTCTLVALVAVTVTVSISSPASARAVVSGRTASDGPANLSCAIAEMQVRVSITNQSPAQLNYRAHSAGKTLPYTPFAVPAGHDGATDSFSWTECTRAWMTVSYWIGDPAVATHAVVFDLNADMANGSAKCKFVDRYNKVVKGLGSCETQSMSHSTWNNVNWNAKFVVYIGEIEDAFGGMHVRNETGGDAQLVSHHGLNLVDKLPAAIAKDSGSVVRLATGQGTAEDASFTYKIDGNKSVVWSAKLVDGAVESLDCEIRGEHAALYDCSIAIKDRVLIAKVQSEAAYTYTIANETEGLLRWREDLGPGKWSDWPPLALGQREQAVFATSRFESDPYKRVRYSVWVEGRYVPFDIEFDAKKAELACRFLDAAGKNVAKPQYTCSTERLPGSLLHAKFTLKPQQVFELRNSTHRDITSGKAGTTLFEGGAPSTIKSSTSWRSVVKQAVGLDSAVYWVQDTRKVIWTLERKAAGNLVATCRFADPGGNTVSPPAGYSCSARHEQGVIVGEVFFG